MGVGTQPLTDGSAAYPWLIEDLADFDAFAGNSAYWAAGVHTRLDCNLDLSVAGTYSNAPINGLFYGHFNGNNRVISNLTIYGVSGLALFLQIENEGIVSNLGVENADITGWSAANLNHGSLCAYNKGTIANCHSTGSVDGGVAVGGLCGNNYGSVTNCYSTCEVTAKKRAGGICGGNGGTIENCTSAGIIAANLEGAGGICGRNDGGNLLGCNSTSTVTGPTAYVGGICGANINGSITNCKSGGSVSSASSRVGGICGYNDGGSITTCYSTSDVRGDSFINGGLCGDNYHGEITNCYATGEVVGDTEVGGLCGRNLGNISYCYSTGAVSGRGNIGGLCGDNGVSIIGCYWDKTTSGIITSNGGQSKTSTEMKLAATFLGWNDGSWTIDEGNNHPRLSWENVAGNPITTDYPMPTYSGSGTSLSPYILATTEDFICMSLRVADWDKYFVMANNIDMTDQYYFPPSEFAGIFDGYGFAVKNLTIDSQHIGNCWRLGLFGTLTGTVDNLAIHNINVQGYYNIGGLCGINYGNIANCYLTGSTTGSYNTGGLCGYNDGDIMNCYSDMRVRVDRDSAAGGLCGYTNYGNIVSCYSIGIVIGGSGFCGSNWGTSITGCFWDVDTSNVGSAGDNNLGAIGKTTEQMQTQSTFTGWDFDPDDGDGADWMMLREHEDYPRLAWQAVFEGDIAGLYGVDMVDFAEVARNWLQTGCPAGCEDADIDGDGQVGVGDLAVLSGDWMKGV
jgi:hypothetical protein